MREKIFSRHITSHKGFTFVELLIVVLIIAILAAIVIPQFAEFRKSAVWATMLSDLRNCSAKAEAWGASNFVYTGFNAGECSITHTNTLIVGNVTANYYTITVTNPYAPAGKQTCSISHGSNITCN